jgi:hypothetical protein
MYKKFQEMLYKRLLLRLREEKNKNEPSRGEQKETKEAKENNEKRSKKNKSVEETATWMITNKR